MTTFLQETTESANRRLKFVLFTLALTVAWNFSSSFLGWGWITATFITFIILLLNLVYMMRLAQKAPAAWSLALAYALIG